LWVESRRYKGAMGSYQPYTKSYLLIYLKQGICGAVKTLIMPKH
jgi:hypothetical protein